MSLPRIRAGAAVFAALAMALGACSDSSGPGTNANIMSQVEATDLGSDVSEDIDDLAELSIYDQSNGVPLQLASINAAPPAACVTVSPDPLTNSDGDAVPDSARFDYSDCGFSRGGGVVFDSLGGTIDIIDPLPVTTSLGVRRIFIDFGRKRVNTVFPLRSFSVVHNGVREWGGNADTLGHTISNFVSVWTHPSGRVTTHEKDWVAKFTAATPGTISLLTPLPAGSFTVNGTGSWSSLNRNFSLAISTVTPLAYDPTCTVAPRFTAGELALVVTRNTQVTNVSIVFTACGSYTVTRS